MTPSIERNDYGKGKKVSENAFFYEGHFRRFVEKEKLISKLKAVGFRIDYEAEERDFAPFGESNPKVIRIVARKE